MELISLKADFAAKELFAHEKVRKQFLSRSCPVVSASAFWTMTFSRAGQSTMPYTVSGTAKGETSQTCGSYISLN
ncbi:MAG: hypothetical protein PUF03_08860 [Lachnospiraceae bacterium]|nr:hypothetical protein [Lachnospiraceae bacterium]